MKFIAINIELLKKIINEDKFDILIKMEELDQLN